jgi:RNA ligase
VLRDRIGWTGPMTEVFAYPSFAAALAAEERPGKEGLVVESLVGGGMLKLKQADYIAMHRIVTGVTARSLWEFLAINACAHVAQPSADETLVDYLVHELRTGPKRIEEVLAAGPDWLDTYLAGVPEEFGDWVLATVHRLAEGALRRLVELCALYLRVSPTGAIRYLTPETRFAFVRAAQDVTSDWRLLMAIHDGEERHTWAWREVYPEPESPFRDRVEAAA